MAIIDFRVRPPFKNYLNFFESAEHLGGFAGQFGLPLAPSIKEKSEELFIKELDEAGIDIGVIPGRQLMGVTNDELFEFADKYPGRFYIFPNINALDTEAALEAIDKYIVHGTGKGISIEPTFGPPEVVHDFDDKRAFPVYEKLQELGVPLMITYSGYVTQNIDDNYNLKLDLLAQAFPNLKIIVAHAGWPWFKETVAIAFRRKNVYLLPDIYANGVVPFSEDMRLAAKYLLPDQILFGTAYPIAPIVESTENAKKWDLTDEGREKFFSGNAKKLLGLE
jgi:hypothetical protein